MAKIPYKTAFGGPYRRPMDLFEPTLTQQSARDECDINNIITKIMRGEVNPHENRYEPRYMDVSDISTDYQAALNLVIHAQETFEGLSAAVRDRFNNDPAEFLAFMDDPDNLDEAVELGLAIRRVPESGDREVPAVSEDAGSREEGA